MQQAYDENELIRVEIKLQIIASGQLLFLCHSGEVDGRKDYILFDEERQYHSVENENIKDETAMTSAFDKDSSEAC